MCNSPQDKKELEKVLTIRSGNSWKKLLKSLSIRRKSVWNSLCFIFVVPVAWLWKGFFRIHANGCVSVVPMTGYGNNFVECMRTAASLFLSLPSFNSRFLRIFLIQTYWNPTITEKCRNMFLNKWPKTPCVSVWRSLCFTNNIKSLCYIKCCCSPFFVLVFFTFLKIEFQSMHEWTATTRRAVSRKRKKKMKSV